MISIFIATGVAWMLVSVIDSVFQLEKARRAKDKDNA